MRSATTNAPEDWGCEEFWLQIPGFRACFTGLSNKQKKQLALDYSDYIIEVNELEREHSAATLVCETYRLDAPIDLSSDELENDGQYSPLKKRDVHGVEITGVNFKAYFTTGKEVNRAALGVTYEEDLTSAIVFENFLRIYTAHNATALGGALLHSAGLVFNNQAYIFVGYSGVGKTTLTRKAHATGTKILSDDINLIMPSGNGFIAYKVPFTGEFGRTVDHTNTAISFPLKAVILLEQGETLLAEATTSSFAVSRLLAGSPFVNTDDQEVKTLFDTYIDLTAKVAVIKLAVPIVSSIDDIMQSIHTIVD